MEEFYLTAKQRRQLELVLHQTCDARLYRRVLAILEVSRGISVEEVAQTLGVTRQSVYNWLFRLDSKECKVSLTDRARSGRPRLLPEQRLAWLKDLMRQRPEARGFRSPFTSQREDSRNSLTELNQRVQFLVRCR